MSQVLRGKRTQAVLELQCVLPPDRRHRGPRAETYMLSQGPEHLLTLEVLCDNYPPSARLFLSFAGGQTRRG